MFPEVCALAKGFPTLTALERLLTCVNPVVFDEVRAPPEASPTPAACIRLFFRMDSLMLDEV